LQPSSPHEIILVKNYPSAADVLYIGLERARKEWVVCVRQHAYLPQGWDRWLTQQRREAGL